MHMARVEVEVGEERIAPIWGRHRGVSKGAASHAALECLPLCTRQSSSLVAQSFYPKACIVLEKLLAFLVVD